MTKLATKTNFILIILLLMNVTTCNNTREIRDCGKRQVSFEEDINIEDRYSNVDRTNYRTPETSNSLGQFIVMGLFGALAVVAAPVALAGVGFTAGGIAAGSYAAGMMSTAAVANGGGVAAGSAVAFMQSVGAAGLGAAGTAAVCGAGVAVGAAVSEALDSK